MPPSFLTVDSTFTPSGMDSTFALPPSIGYLMNERLPLVSV